MKIIIALRWIGRIASVLLAVFLALIAIFISKGGKQISATDLVGSIFLLCMIIGLVLSWPKEKAGIIMSYAGFFGVFVMMLAMHERDIMNIWYCALPTTLLLICRLAEKKIKLSEKINKQ